MEFLLSIDRKVWIAAIVIVVALGVLGFVIKLVKMAVLCAVVAVILTLGSTTIANVKKDIGFDYKDGKFTLQNEEFNIGDIKKAEFTKPEGGVGVIFTMQDGTYRSITLPKKYGLAVQGVVNTIESKIKEGAVKELSKTGK